MYIEPNSTIKIYRSIPLDPSYSNTLYFNSIAEQNNFFHGEGLAKFTLNAQTYQRVERGRMRVEIPADSLYDCNYLAFKNTSYGQKWFYAFITGVEYLNNQVSEIRFSIDSMQTYMCDMELCHCFVEREHSVTDEIGDNILPEPTDLGEYVMSEYTILDSALTDLCVIIAIVDTQKEAVKGTSFDGIYAGTTLYAFDQFDVDGIDAFLADYLIRPEAIVSMYVAPKFLIGDIPTNHLINPTGNSHFRQLIKHEWNVRNQTNIDGYSNIRNKKLFTYPYNYFNIDNANGNSLVLRYEKFNDLQPSVKIIGSIKEPVSIVLHPVAYKGSPAIDPLHGWVTLNTESLSIDNYPLCSWNYDSFYNWLGQSSVPMAISALSGAMNLLAPPAVTHTLRYNTMNTNNLMAGVVGTPFGNIAGIGGSRTRTDFSSETITEHQRGVQFNGVASALTDAYSASIKADVCRGTTNSANVNISNNIQTFWCCRTHIDYQHAKVIDGFFDMFGYATNEVKIPNINSRPHWNYVKTNGCIIRGSIPADEISRIESIFDHGITFWKSASEVGNYSLDNSPE